MSQFSVKRCAKANIDSPGPYALRHINLDLSMRQVRTVTSNITYLSYCENAVPIQSLSFQVPAGTNYV